MSTEKKRVYNSESRVAQAQETRKRILSSARNLFTSQGFEKTTIDRLAELAYVSTPTIYSLFKSKEGILRELMHAILFGPQYKLLVDKALSLADPKETLKMAASITRAIYDAEKSEMVFIRGASAISPELRKLETEGERQRYERQEFVVLRLEKASLLPIGMDVTQARDILWTLTSRELYRMLVTVRRWNSDDYEQWLSRTLLQTLIITPVATGN